MTPLPVVRTPQEVLIYWRDKLKQERDSEANCRRHGMPDQAKWHEGQADAIDHFLLDFEWLMRQLPTSAHPEGFIG